MATAYEYEKIQTYLPTKLVSIWNKMFSFSTNINWSPDKNEEMIK